MINEIIEFIKRNRVSTTDVADCLGKTGHVAGLMPVNRGHFCVGKVKWTLAYASSNWPVHRDIRCVSEDEIIFIDSWDCENRAIVGELVAKYVLLYRQCGALLCSGSIRDAGAIIRENYQVWCSGFNPVGCFNEEPDAEPDQLYASERRELIEGSIAVCDDTGVVIIPRKDHTSQFLEKLQAIELQEDIWFDRLDRYKENTLEIVCEKKYLITEE